MNPWERQSAREPVKQRHALPAGVLFACAVLLALRRPDALANPQFWAEDVLVFFDGALQNGVSSLWGPNAGYFHAWPRLLAGLSLLLDPAWAPTVFAYGAWAIAISAVAMVLWARWPGSAWTGVVAALGLTLAPHYSEEIFLTPTNLQWLLAPLLVAVLLTAPPKGRIAAPLWLLASFLAGMTSPFIVVLAPLIAWRWWSERKNGGAWLYGLLMAAAVLQLGAILFTGGVSQSVPWGPPLHYLRVIGFRLGIETFLPEAWWPHSPAIWLLVGLAVVALVVFFGVKSGPQRTERLVLAFSILGFLLTAFYRTRPDQHLLLDVSWGDRYLFSVRVLLLWLLWMGLAPTSDWARRAPVLAMLLLMPAASLSRYQSAARADLRWRDYAPAIRAGSAVDIPIHPMGWTYRYPGKRKHPLFAPASVRP